jgi:hypothetical protein
MAALGPADLQLVFECLKGALSQNSAIQKQAEAALHTLEARPGFCSCLAVRGALSSLLGLSIVELAARAGSGLEAVPIAPSGYHTRHFPCLVQQCAVCFPQEIIPSKEADHSARWLAAVHFKNSVNKYWRSRVTGCVWLVGPSQHAAG